MDLCGVQSFAAPDLINTATHMLLSVSQWEQCQRQLAAAPQILTDLKQKPEELRTVLCTVQTIK